MRFHLQVSRHKALRASLRRDDAALGVVNLKCKSFNTDASFLLHVPVKRVLYNNENWGFVACLSNSPHIIQHKV